MWKRCVSSVRLCCNNEDVFFEGANENGAPRQDSHISFSFRNRFTGGGTNAYVGNIRFRAVVAQHQPRYLVCRRADKEVIAAEIVQIIHQRGGRFLSKNEAGQWEEVTEKKAINKASQALREGMNVRGGTLKSPERESKFASALSKTKSQQAVVVKEDANSLIAKLPTMPRSQLEAVARALLCSGSNDAVSVAISAMNGASA